MSRTSFLQNRKKLERVYKLHMHTLQRKHLHMFPTSHRRHTLSHIVLLYRVHTLSAAEQPLWVGYGCIVHWLLQEQPISLESTTHFVQKGRPQQPSFQEMQTFFVLSLTSYGTGTARYFALRVSYHVLRSFLLTSNLYHSTQYLSATDQVVTFMIFLLSPTHDLGNL